MAFREIELLPDSVTLRVYQNRAWADLATGATVWDAGLVLAHYLAKQHQGEAQQGSRELRRVDSLGVINDRMQIAAMTTCADGTCVVQGKRVLELGAGTGVVGLAAAALGAARVVLTDQEAVTPMLEQNIALNQLHVEASAVAQPLMWGDAAQLQDALAALGGAPDVVLAADCVYQRAALPALVQTISSLLSVQRGGGGGGGGVAGQQPPVVLVAVEERPGGVVEEFLGYLRVVDIAHETVGGVV